MKRYEGLFILNVAGREEGLKEVVDRITDEITKGGGKVEAVQKMDKRSFSRVANKKHNSGYYTNIVFEGPSDLIANLRVRFANDEEVFRALYTMAPVAIETTAAASSSN